MFYYMLYTACLNGLHSLRTGSLSLMQVWPVLLLGHAPVIITDACGLCFITRLYAQALERENLRGPGTL